MKNTTIVISGASFSVPGDGEKRALLHFKAGLHYKTKCNNFLSVYLRSISTTPVPCVNTSLLLDELRDARNFHSNFIATMLGSQSFYFFFLMPWCEAGLSNIY